MEVTNKEWTDEEFFKVRKEVLGQWHTGKEIEDIDECIDYNKKLPDEKRLSLRYKMCEKEDKTEVHLMIGLCTIEQMLEHMLFIEDLKPQWSLHPDTWTRSHQFERVAEAIERSKREGRSVLNGYPLINYGAKATRKITESISGSLNFNVSNRDTRLQAEMVLGAGWTGITTHALNDLAQHHKDCPLDEKIRYSQYNSKLAAYYSKRGAPIMCDLPGNFSGWDMPGFRASDVILEALLTAEQGNKEISMSLDLGLSLIQDTAAYRVLKKLSREYLDKGGYSDANLYIRADGWLGDFPQDIGRANGITSWQIVIPVLAGVHRIFLKSVDEALSISTKEGNRMALTNARQLLILMGNQRLPDSPELNLEEEMIEKEVRATVDKVIEIGDGDVAVGMVKAIDYGVLDTQFSPWHYLKGKVLLVRDSREAIRYLDHANVPLPKEVIQYHKEKIAEREKKEGQPADLEWVIENVTRVSQPL
jgi:methylaspartate mutase epsilon subunit